MTDNVPYTADELEVSKLLLPGAANAIKIAEISRLTRMDDRKIKGVVRDLRLRHGMPVVGEKAGAHAGYYIADSAAEYARASGTLRTQGLSMLRVAAHMDQSCHAAMLRDIGQLQFELQGRI